MRLGPAAAGQAYEDHVLVTNHVIGRRTVLAVDGEIDLASVPVLGSAIDAALADGAAELWIDLTDTRFMDSSGVHLLVATRSRVRDLNRRLAIVCPRGSVRHLLEVAGVIEHLPVYEDRAAAHHAG
jgi:anti-sigma B factor antagonist